MEHSIDVHIRSLDVLCRICGKKADKQKKGKSFQTSVFFTKHREKILSTYGLKTESLTKHRLINNKAWDLSYRFIGLNKGFAAVHNMIAGDISIDEELIILIDKNSLNRKSIKYLLLYIFCK